MPETTPHVFKMLSAANVVNMQRKETPIVGLDTGTAPG
jgi:hypothetical protein